MTKTPHFRPPDKRVHIALPVRITLTDSGARKVLAYACTYDIHPNGARISGAQDLFRVGDKVTVERGKNKNLCRVTWVGDNNSDLRGQFTVESLDDRPMWQEELRDTEEMYAPITLDQRVRPAFSTYSADKNRRRSPRFSLEARAGFLKVPNFQILNGKVRDLSELGCLIRTENSLLPGTDVKLVLNVTDCDLTVKGQVRHAVRGTVGVEFYQIRTGDRPLLQYLLRKLAGAGQAAQGKVLTLEFA